MADIPTVFPRRPLTLHMPRAPFSVWLWNTLSYAFLGGIVVALAIWARPSLQADWELRDIARPVRGTIEHGKCHSKIFVHICDLTLVNLSVRPAIRQDVTYVFTDFHVGEYQVAVMADPKHPERLTSDLGLDQLTSRIFTALVVILLVVAGLVLSASQSIRRAARRCAVATMSGQTLTPVPLTLTSLVNRRAGSTWMVRQGNEKPVRWDFPAKSVPFMAGGDNRILGVIGPAGGIACPMDAELRWIYMTDSERAALRAVV